MKTNTLKFALLPLLALSALALVPSVFAQGTVSIPLSLSYEAQYSLDWGSTIIPIPVGNPAVIPGYGQINIQVYSAPVGTASPFSADNAGLIPAPWIASSTTPLHQIIGAPGLTPLTTFSLTGVAGGANAEVMVVGWTGSSADWNTAWAAGNALYAWTGSQSSGGALAWVNGTGNPGGSPPSPPVALVTGAAGYNGLHIYFAIPEPSTFALAGLGAAMLMIFRRRK